MSDAVEVKVRVKVQVSPPGEDPQWVRYLNRSARFAALPMVGDVLMVSGVEPPFSVPEPTGTGAFRVSVPSTAVVGILALVVEERRISDHEVLLDAGVMYDDEQEDEASLTWGEIIVVLENAGYSRWEEDPE